MLRKILQRRARSAGFDVRRTTLIGSPIGWLLDFARKSGATTVLDVGANIGQFARSVIDEGWDGRIVSFEPLTAAHRQLSDAAARYRQWQVAPRGALGAARSAAEINIAANSQSSSLLPMLDRHLQAAPDSGFIARETVTVTPLDEAVASLPATERFLLKMDVQGFEAEVLRGAAHSLSRIPVIYTEMSLQSLYEGEKLFGELADEIIGLGYRCIGLQPGYVDPKTREMLQVDGTFLRVEAG